jgi:isoleucyl-tRNA synthetase
VLEEIVRKVLLTYWNTVSFLVIYANAAASPPDATAVSAGVTAADPAVAAPDAAVAVADAAVAVAEPAARPLLDRWLLSELHMLIRDVTDALEAFDPVVAGRRIAGFIDDLSNWYVRRSRRRFWAGTGSPETASAFATLRSVLDVLTRLMAPITPFLTDYVWAVLRAPDAPDSVHLASWPRADPSLIDTELARQMALARRLVELGRSARASAVVKVRQPLARALISAAGFAQLPEALTAQVAEELNVRVLEPLDTSDAELVSHTVRPNFRALGKRFGNGTQPVAAAIGAADAATLAAQLRDRGTAEVIVNGTAVSVGPDDVIVTQTPRSGWAVAADGSETVAIEVAITPELRREGLARDAIRLIQEARKSDGLALTDRVMLRWSTADPELADALAEHGQLIADEVLAADFAQLRRGAADAGGIRHSSEELGLTFWLQRLGPEIGRALSGPGTRP